jgi:hypothetical protein
MGTILPALSAGGWSLAAACALALGGEMLSAVGSFDAGCPPRGAHRSAIARRPLSPLPALLARLGIDTQEVAGAERDQPPEPGQIRLLDRDSLPEFECNRKFPGPRHPAGPSLMASEGHRVLSCAVPSQALARGSTQRSCGTRFNRPRILPQNFFQNIFGHKPRHMRQPPLADPGPRIRRTGAPTRFQ